MTAPEAQVVVVGGGPAGVVAALELARRGIDVRIIDAAAAPMAGSRAKGLQPRTLELLERLGLIEEILAAGGPFPRWRSYRGGALAWEKSIFDLLWVGAPAPDPAVPYPETWMIPQWRTEEILRRELARHGARVEYGCVLDGLEVDEQGSVATIRTAHGTQHVRSTYVIGADGAASATRRLLGISYDGVTREDERYVIADVRTPDLDRTFWHNWSDPADPAARVSICPLPGTDTFQYVAPIPPGAEPPALTLGTIQRLFDERSEGVAVRFSAAPWITVHRTNERLANRFRVGRVFLVGDAVHAVPAAGGQGLNTAVQDSHNLGWKLAAVLRGAPERLLDTYEEERRPIAARLMAGLDAVDAHGEKPDIFQPRNTYRAGSLSDETWRSPGAVHAGDRAPDVPLQGADGGARRLHQRLREREFTAVAFGDEAAGDCAAVAREWSTCLDLGVLDVRWESPATAELAGTIYGVPPGEQAVFLVRPDGHVGLAAEDNMAPRLSDYWRGWPPACADLSRPDLTVRHPSMDVRYRLGAAPLEGRQE